MKQVKRLLSAVLALTLLLGMMLLPASAISLNTKMVIDPVYEDAHRFTDGYAAVKLNGKWGYINDTGDMVIEAKYDWVGEFAEDVAVVAKLEECVTLEGVAEQVYVLYLVDASGKEVQLPSIYTYENGDPMPLYYGDYTELNSAGTYFYCVDGVVNAGDNPYTTKGEMILPRNTQMLYQEEGYPYNSFYMVDNCIDGVIPMCGYCMDGGATYQLFHMDKEGNILRTLPATVTGESDWEYDYISAPHNGLFQVYMSRYIEEGEYWDYVYGVQNENGEWVLKPEYEHISAFIGGTFAHDDRIVASKDSKYGLFNTKGAPITAMEYDYIYPIRDGFTVAEKDGIPYIMDKDGNLYAIAGLNGETVTQAYVTSYGKLGIAAVQDTVTGDAYCISKKPMNGVMPVVTGSEELGAAAYFVDVNGDGSRIILAPPSELIAVYRDGKWGYALLDVEHDNPFNDLKEGKFYVDAVLWAVYENITTGVTATEFQPDKACTRSQIVTFIWRAMGCPEPESTVNPFTDVKEDAYYYKAVLWAVENGITTGKTATTFAPKEACTRNQAVTFLWRAAGEPEPESTAHTFADVSDNAYYADAVLWAVENGITNGVNETTFAPKQECTRGHIVTFLYRNLVG